LDCTVPFARPAAGLPGTCGGYALAVRAAHFLATSAVTADALPFMHTTAMQTNPTSALSNFTWANMICSDFITAQDDPCSGGPLSGPGGMLV